MKRGQARTLKGKRLEDEAERVKTSTSKTHQEASVLNRKETPATSPNCGAGLALMFGVGRYLAFDYLMVWGRGIGIYGLGAGPGLQSKQLLGIRH